MRSQPRSVPRALLGLAVLGGLVQAASADAGFTRPRTQDPVESPRFEVPEGATFPLRSTDHQVVVVGPIAHVKLTQTYVNEGDGLLDATYVFPGSTRSAVASLVMKIGDRTVKAVLEEKEEARADFERARREGYRASLLEQDRPNVFRMALTNIRPGEKVEVTLGYTELIETEAGVSELVLPAVVAPRFGGEAEGSGERPTLRPGAGPAWSADIRLADGLAITEVSSPTHDISPRVDQENRIQVALRTKGEKELVLRWRVVSGTRPEAGLTVYQGEDESFFMMTVAPPERIAVEETPPREVAFVLDVSCSMRGFPLDVAKTVMEESLQKLRPEDHFNVLFFSGSGWTFAPEPVPATQQNVARALETVGRQRGGGGTQLVRALDRIASSPRAPNLARTVVVVTDGLVSFEKRAFAKVREKLHGTTVFTLGIGSNVNRMLIEGLARAGGGTSYVAHDKPGARREAERLVHAMAAPVLTGLKLDAKGLEVYDLEPPVLPDLYADQPVVVVGKFRGPLQGSLRISGAGGRSSFERTIPAGQARASAVNAPLRALWARRRLQRIADDRDLADGGADQTTIVALGLKYGLLTDHTAFIAVDSEGGKAEGRRTTVEQPSAHPDGMQVMAARRTASGAASARVPRRRVKSMRLGASGLGSGGGGYGRAGAAAPPPVPPAGSVAEAGSPRRSREAEASEAANDARRHADSTTAMKLELSPLITQGGIDRAAAETMLRRALPRLKRRLRDAGDLGSNVRVTFELEIDDEGRVTGVTRVDGMIGKAAVTAAIERELRRLRMPAPDAAGKVRFTFVAAGG